MFFQTLVRRVISIGGEGHRSSDLGRRRACVPRSINHTRVKLNQSAIRNLSWNILNCHTHLL